MDNQQLQIWLWSLGFLLLGFGVIDGRMVLVWLGLALFALGLTV